MILYDHYSDLFLLLKLVDASRTPRPRVIHLEWSCETDAISTLSLVKFICIIPSNIS